MTIALLIIIGLVLADIVAHEGEASVTYMIVMWIWQLPQFVLGLVVWLAVSRRCRTGRRYLNEEETVWFEYTVCPWRFRAGLSLSGGFIFVPDDADNDMIRHEQGHAMQSWYLGPLYLVVIGLPSLIWAGLHRLPKLRNLDYYAFYTEKWADRLAEVKR